MASALILLALGILVTLAACIFDVLTNDPLVRGPLTAVIAAFLIPGCLLLSINAGRKIESLPSKTPTLRRASLLLGAPRVLFGVVAMVTALILPFAALRAFSFGIVQGQTLLLPLVGLVVSPMLMIAGDFWIRRGIGISSRPTRRVRIGWWEMDEVPFHVRVLLLACALTLAASLSVFTVGVGFFGFTRAALAWRPEFSAPLFLLTIPLAILILRRGRSGEKPP